MGYIDVKIVARVSSHGSKLVTDHLAIFAVVVTVRRADADAGNQLCRFCVVNHGIRSISGAVAARLSALVGAHRVGAGTVKRIQRVHHWLNRRGVARGFFQTENVDRSHLAPHVLFPEFLLAPDRIRAEAW